MAADFTTVLKCEKLDEFACLTWRKKIYDRLWAVGYVGGKHLLSLDTDNYIFALCLMDAIARGIECYLW